MASSEIDQEEPQCHDASGGETADHAVEDLRAQRQHGLLTTSETEESYTETLSRASPAGPA
jgi:hypothetical protein